MRRYSGSTAHARTVTGAPSTAVLAWTQDASNSGEDHCSHHAASLHTKQCHALGHAHIGEGQVSGPCQVQLLSSLLTIYRHM